VQKGELKRVGEWLTYYLKTTKPIPIPEILPISTKVTNQIVTRLFFDPEGIITDCLPKCKHNGFVWMYLDCVMVAKYDETPAKTRRGGGLSTSAFVNPAAYSRLSSSVVFVY